ncbi:hypothetical protein E1176_12805 [Fulvivirga sp. RKSG066]|uniref:FISUMP domain-containing protein n=1 Tax=Fulvivirga aurantia TaxID=2529383 RepID=UPI0012BC531D|nr:FISUMP domain-containing protein [Fulvivirga aurantia]MTI21905.1 hypothetical protein [Fulvivirga aurantia]
MKVIVCALLVSIYANLNAQSTFVDPRDGQSYNTVQVGQTLWLSSNLRFETSTSHCPASSTTDCAKGNYYTYTEAREVCPTGWRLPTLEDWDEYHSVTVAPEISERYFDSNTKKYKVEITADSLSYFAPGNKLNLQMLARVEGEKLVKGSFLDLWTTNKEFNDDKFHVHITSNTIQGHAHKHNIIDKKEKIRKFGVRCVRK